MTRLHLLSPDGSSHAVELAEAPAFRRPTERLTSRVAYAAAHVAPRVTGQNVPGAPADIDWDATLAFRHHVWSWGLGVADAMDTAQRNMGLDPVAVRELIARSAAEASGIAAERGVTIADLLVVGVNTDHEADDVLNLDEVRDAYVDQLRFTESTGAGVVLMASRHLARAASSAADYERVYREVLSEATEPVVLHWLGEAFDPSLRGYFGSTDTPTASETVLRIIEDHADVVRGIKMSLLDADAEVALRARLPDGVTLFTGDDFNYVSLIGGDGERYSDALLGAFAAVAPAASAAIQALDADDAYSFARILGPTEELSRHIFEAPTWFYKTGVAFLAWLNGHQPAFTMVGGLHAGRSLPHLSELIRLANGCGALEHPETAAARWHGMLAQAGVATSEPARV